MEEQGTHQSIKTKIIIWKLTKGTKYLKRIERCHADTSKAVPTAARTSEGSLAGDQNNEL